MREGVLQQLHAKRSPMWTVVNEMRVPESCGGEADRQAVLLSDLSCLVRTGLKGPGAAEWLDRQAVSVPPRANSWGPLPGGGMIARLAETEFLLEDPLGGRLAVDVGHALGKGAKGVYPVARKDVALFVWGTRLNDVLLETCSVNFAAVSAPHRELVLTSMIGVSVLAIPWPGDAAPACRIWADPSFGRYLWEALLEIVEEMGGGPAGIKRCAQRIPIR